MPDCRVPSLTVWAAVLEAANRIAVRDVPEPSPAPGDVLLDVLACGVCGSDVSMISGGFPSGAVLGHEVVGRVLPGPEPKSFEEDEVVVVRPNAWCGSCSWCSTGRHQLCSDAISHGLGIGRQGGFAERIAVPADLCRRVRGVEVLDAVFADPFAVAVHAVDRAASSDASFAVLGLGPTGLAVLSAALTMGMGPGIAVDRHPVKQRHALALGASAVTRPGDFDGISDALGGAPEVVFECSGRPAAIADAVSAASLGAVVVLVGLSMHDAQIAPSILLTKELDVRASYCYNNEDWELALSMLEDGRARLGSIVDGPTSLRQLPESLDLLAAGKVTKVVAVSDELESPALPALNA